MKRIVFNCLVLALFSKVNMIFSQNYFLNKADKYPPIYNTESVRITDKAKAIYQFLNPLPQGNDLRYVKIFNQNEAVALGVRGTFLKTTNAGSTWSVSHYIGGQSGTGLGLYGNFFNKNYGTIVGGGRSIASTSNSGITWEDQIKNVQLSYDPMTRLYGCAHGDSVNAWAVGYFGKIFFTSNNGNKWISQSSGTNSNLYATYFLNKDIGFVVGDGIVLKTTNKGTTWYNPQGGGGGTIPDSQVVLYLKMDENSGNTLFDSSIYGNNGSVVGTIPIVSGKYGNGRSFSGGSLGPYVNIAHSQSISPTNAITVECFVKPSNITQSSSIIRKSDGGQVSGYQLAMYYQGKISFQLIRSSSSIIVTGNTILQPNVWTHIAGTYDGISLKVYVNGVLDGTTTFVGTIEQSSSPLGIGAIPRASGNDGYSGKIDEVKISNYAITSFNLDYKNSTSNMAGSIYYGIHFIDSNIGTIVGSSGTILKTTNGGVSWITQSSGTTLTLNSVTYINSSIGLVVGQSGYIIKTTNGGSTWVLKSSGVNLDLQSISFTSDGYGYTVGFGGVILYTTDYGENWIKQSIGTTSTLFAISFANQLIGASVGEQGTILKTTNGGLDWIKQTSNITNTLYGVDFYDSIYITAVGSNGKIIHSSDGGNSWYLQNSGFSNTLNEIIYLNKDTLFIVGSSGLLLYSSNRGQIWSQRNSGTTQTLNDIYFSDNLNGTIVGSYGTILRTTNGGNSWNSQNSGTTNALNAVHFYNANIGAVVTTDHSYFTLRTTNGGQTWIQKTNLAGDAYYDVFCTTDSTYLCVSSVGGISRAIKNGDEYIDERSIAHNSLYGIEVVPNSNGFVVYAVGYYGMILATVYSPVKIKTWAGTVDSLWDNPNNWNPIGVPTVGDSIIIVPSTYFPTIKITHQQVTISALNISSGGKLVIDDDLKRFVIISDLNIAGTLKLENLAKTALLIGGNWKLNYNQNSMLVDNGFEPGNSTVQFDGQGNVFGNFFNLNFNLYSDLSSIGNISVDGYCGLNSDLTLRNIDTVTINNDEPNSLSGTGIINNGTIKRSIKNGSFENYRFESPSTYINFASASVYPSVVSIKSYPNTSPGTFSGNWTAYSSVSTWRCPDSNYVITSGVPSITNWTLGYLSSFSEGQPRIKRVLSGGSDLLKVNYLTNLLEVGFRYEDSEIESGTNESQLVLLFSNSIVPVELQNFIYKLTKNGVHLLWQTATEIDNYGFEIERLNVIPNSLSNWQKIGFVQGHGNSNSMKEYSFVDRSVIGGSKFAYRLKQIDNGGNFKYSYIIEVDVMPVVFSLSQNYPNPFNPSTTIEYQIPKKSLIVLKVFNALGEEVTTLVNEEKEPGYYEAEFNSQKSVGQKLNAYGKFSSGVYFYQLRATPLGGQAGDFVSTKKFVLMK